MAKKILIIEDEHILVGMYADQFHSEKWSVITATTKDEGIEMTKKEHPDIVLLDILLFDGTGIEYLQAKKEDSAIASIPVIVFSNLDDTKTKEEALKLGALEYLLKANFTPQELVQKASFYLT
ncbi:MAG: response regulator [bacterium]|nr:response regulator [bacterium]